MMQGRRRRDRVVAGVDGCRSGWIAIVRNFDTGVMCPHVFENLSVLLEGAERPTVIAIDIPIGLTDDARRRCDTEARKVLGWPRSASVFSAPTRPVLACSGWPEANEMQKRLCGRGMSQQSWGIAKKIGEVDDLMSRQPEARRRFWEVHPEVSFWAWQGRAMEHSKKTAPGRERRRQLVASHFGSNAERDVRNGHLVKQVGHDDILDTFAALWTAERIYRGAHDTLPEDPVTDARGLPMRIVY
jgi:predicted RNase H-like nuclease